MEPAMRANATIIASIALLLVAAAASATEADPAARIAAQDGWAAWQVPGVAGLGSACCHEWHGHGMTTGDCDLEGRSWSIGNDDDDRHAAGSDNMNIYVHVAAGRIDKARAFSSTCKVRNADKVRWIDPVASGDSIAFLSGNAATAAQELADVELAAIAMHADAAATPALTQLADTKHPRKLRGQALFWLAQARGAEGAQIVERIATSDPDADLRADAVFDLSQAHGYDGYAGIHRIAQTDASEHVREQALFWMAQTGDRRARDDILAAIATEKSDSVREQAVFALSQLKDDQADAALIALVRGDHPRKVKEQALFWLGQSGSDAAMQFIDEVLTGSAGKSARR
jgi:HEAT repeat protein